MSLTPTKPIPLGFDAPAFSLLDVVSGTQITFQDIRGDKGTLVMFICNHCPYVIHVMDELIRLGNDYMPQGIGMVAISSNDVKNYPQDHPDKMKELALHKNFPFPYLYDDLQDVAKAYDAVCTPDFNLFNADGKCVYRGQLDGSRPGNSVPVDGREMRKALDLVVKGLIVPENQIPSQGCNIKWKQ